MKKSRRYAKHRKGAKNACNPERIVYNEIRKDAVSERFLPRLTDYSVKFGRLRAE